MALLRLHPKIDFDFEVKTTKSNRANQSLSVMALCLLLLISLVGLVKTIGPEKHKPMPAGSQYSNSLKPKNIFGQVAQASSATFPTAPLANYSAEVPILIYHYTPVDFEVQLQHLQSHGYTTISMSDLGRFLYTGIPLPAKPVVITFDDGFLDQQRAFELLKNYQMKATLYLVLGGVESNSCIGLTRTNLACGDSYLNWSQVKGMTDSNLVEIGAHTINHLDLANLVENRQWEEIIESKKRLESMYNLSVTTFAYPYGRYNQSTIDLVSKAGFLTAVTTNGGTIQSSSQRYVMPRVRNALLLP